MTSEAIRARRIEIASELRSMLESARSEGRALRDEDRTRRDALSAELDSLERSLADADAEAAVVDRLHRIDEESRERAEREAASRGQRTPDGGEDRYRSVFGQYIRSGTEALTGSDLELLRSRHVTNAGWQNRDQTTATGPGGGFVVPQGFWAKITEVAKAYGGMLQVANNLRTDTGNNMPWPTNDDTANVGELLGENQSDDTALDLLFGVRSLGAFMFTSRMMRVSFQMLQDPGIDVEAYIARKMGQRLGRIMNTYFTTGTGAAQPQGLITGATKTYTCPNSKGLKYFLNAQANSGAGWTPNNGGSTVGIDYQQIVNLVHAIDPAYRENMPYEMGGNGLGGKPMFMMHDVTLSGIRMIQSSTGFPLWQPSLQPGVPGTILGYPYVINQSMPIAGGTLSGTTGSVAGVLAFGDFKQGYVVRTVNGGSILRLNERFADQLQVAFLGYERHDGIVDDPNAFALLTTAAS